jgi:hypothetical protein
MAVKLNKNGSNVKLNGLSKDEDSKMARRNSGEYDLSLLADKMKHGTYIHMHTR